MATNLKFYKKERLKSRKVIQSLFQTRQSVHVFPLRVIWGKIDPVLSSFPAQFGVSVPKRAFPKAVHRNRIKRIIREAYRLNKAGLYKRLEEQKGQYGLMFLYSGKQEPTLEEIEKSLKKLFKILPKRIVKSEGPS